MLRQPFEPAPNLGVYVQIPFCASKCSFCNFSSRVAPSSALDSYCRAVEREIHGLPQFLSAAGIPARILGLPVNTLYFGGGTPLIVGPERLSRIVQGIYQKFKTHHLDEFTVEATPGSADLDALRSLRRLGVNRLSVGAQTFDDRELRSVGRLHTSADTREMISAARHSLFSNISIDIIVGLPYQTGISWQKSLKTLAQIRPEHVSVYIFEIDEKSRLGSEAMTHGTRFHASAIPDEDWVADAYEAACEFLQAEGYRQYEISNFAVPGFESKHNLKYWRLEPYIGLGAGAHSFEGERRWSNVTAPAPYESKLQSGATPIERVANLSADEQLEEFFYVGLRQARGVSLAQAEQRWGSAAVDRWRPTINDLTRQELLTQDAEQLCLTRAAYLVSNEVFQRFLY